MFSGFGESKDLDGDRDDVVIEVFDEPTLALIDHCELAFILQTLSPYASNHVLVQEGLEMLLLLKSIFGTGIGCVVFEYINLGASAYDLVSTISLLRNILTGEELLYIQKKYRVSDYLLSVRSRSEWERVLDSPTMVESLLSDPNSPYLQLKRERSFWEKELLIDFDQAEAYFEPKRNRVDWDNLLCYMTQNAAYMLQSQEPYRDEAIEVFDQPVLSLCGKK